MAKTAGWLGLMAVVIFGSALLLFGMLNPAFHFWQDYISQLGAQGAPYAVWWNGIGFLLVGILLMGFGMAYGKIVEDRVVGILLALFGLGFAFTAIPINMENTSAPVSKAHIVAICLALACWLFGLAKLSSNRLVERKVRVKANLAAIILVAAMFGFVLGFWSMPWTHRLVFGVVFGWTAITAVELLLARRFAASSE